MDEKARELVSAERKKIQSIIAAVLETEAGVELFKYLHRITGFSNSSLVFNQQTGIIDPGATTYNEARRLVYLQLRALIAPGKLREIELPIRADE